jgi:glycerol uptake facilitator-like aquaporin
MTADMPRRLIAEALATAMLLAPIVGSGIMADRLADGNVAVALLANTIATAAALDALILTLGPISGAHFNPAVSIADASQNGLRPPAWSRARCTWPNARAAAMRQLAAPVMTCRVARTAHADGARDRSHTHGVRACAP